MDQPLTKPGILIPLLKKYGLYTQKKFGQHWLTDQSVIIAALEAANISEEDIIVEVGAGTGVLTQQLSSLAKHVVAFEIDGYLQPLLAETLANSKNVELHFQDFLSALDKLPNLPYKFVANLPYNVGSHILDVLIKSPNPPISITVLLQKEVADKITAHPPHATYLSNFVGLYGQSKLIKSVKPSAFFPPPKVESSLIHIQAHSQKYDYQALSKFLHHGFSNPRKMLNKVFETTLLEQLNISSQMRPENLSLEEWLHIYQHHSSAK